MQKEVERMKSHQGKGEMDFAAEREKLKEALFEKSRLLDSSEDTVKIKDSEISLLKRDTERLRSVESSQKAIIRSMAEKIDMNNSSRANAFSELFCLQNEVQRMKSYQDKKEKNFASERHDFKTALNEKTRLLESFENTIKIKDSEIDLLKKDIEMRNSEMSMLHAAEDSYRGIIHSLEEEINGCKNARLPQLQKELETLKGQENYEDRNHELDLFWKDEKMEASESKRIKELEEKNEKNTERIMDLMERLLAKDDRNSKLSDDIRLERAKIQILEKELKKRSRCNIDYDHTPDNTHKVKEEMLED